MNHEDTKDTKTQLLRTAAKLQKNIRTNTLCLHVHYLVKIS